MTNWTHGEGEPVYYDPEGSVTVGELRKWLTGKPDEMQVVMSCDAEGNGFSPLSALDVGPYDPETTWSGQVYVAHDVVDDPDSEYTEEDRAPETAQDVVVLWPTN